MTLFAGQTLRSQTAKAVTGLPILIHYTHDKRETDLACHYLTDKVCFFLVCILGHKMQRHHFIASRKCCATCLSRCLRDLPLDMPWLEFV